MPQSTLPDDPIRLQCRHIHADGRRCGSPCVRTQNFCYYHGQARRPGPRQPHVKTLADRKSSTFDLPSPADLAERAGIQLAIAHILQKIAHNEIDPRRAGLLLYGLQIASMNIKEEPTNRKQARRENLVEPVEELVVDADLGALAPEAEYSEYQGPMSTVERLIHQLEQLDNDVPPPAPQPHTPRSVLDDLPEPLSLSASAAPPAITLAPCPPGHRSPGTRHTSRYLPFISPGGPDLTRVLRGL